MLLFCQNSFAEGTKQLAPTSDDRVYIQPSPNGFGYYNGPEDLRLQIHIANPNSEQVFLGFGRPTTSAVYPCSGSLTNAFFRIKDPNGNVVFPTPGSNNGQILDGVNSNISTYAQAVAGPSPIVGGSGYAPYVFNPDGLPAGDYYIEFSSSIGSAGSSTINLEWFDITVATEGGSPTAIDGRVYSKIWSMYAPRIQCNCGDPTYGCFDRPFNGKFNIYVPQDSTVIEVDFAGSGMQPAFFNVFFNSYGTSNTGNVNVDRMSLNSQQVFATEYPIFLNNPDENIYPSGEFGTYFEEPFFHTCNGESGTNGAAVEFIGSVTKTGQLEVLIDLEDPGNFEFTPNSKDVNIAIKIDPQPGELPPYVGVIEWDGLDGLGNPVDLSQNLTYRMKYSQAIVHFPIYDAEYMIGGFNVETIRPIPPPNAFQVYLYYDDSNIPDATGNSSPKINLDGCAPPCHTWTNFNYGNVNTINTYFFGSEERTFLEEPAVCLVQAVDDEDSTTVNVPVIIDVLGNDVGTNIDPTSVNTTDLLQPTNGTIAVNPVTGEITYTPNPGFTGVDIFEYEVCDADGITCSIATVTVTVMMPSTETDCADGFDNDGDGLIDCDDPDCEMSPDCEQPFIGIAKSNTSTVNNGDGTFTVSFLFTVENFGNVDLSDLTIFDDIVGQFAGMNPTNFMTQNGTLTANTSWNGTATSNILNANQMLAVGTTGTVSVSFDITPGTTQNAENEATAEGTSPLGEMTTDTSTDGTDADGDDGDDNPDEMTPTVVEFKEMPSIGVAKNNASTVNNGDGTYDISFDFVIENFGDVNLSDLMLFDDVVGQFAGMNPTNFMTQNGTFAANTNWNGTATSNILNSGQSLNVGQSGTVSISFTVTPGMVMTVNNTATTGGITPAGTTVNDTSTAGTDADGNDNDNDPDENDPTVVDFMESSLIGVAKNNTVTTNNGDGTYDVSFDFVIENFGDVNLSNITLFDDVFGQFAGMNPTNFSATSGTLTANTGWNGTATSNILAPGQNLNIGANGTVSISFTVTPGAATSVMNTATAGGTTPAGNMITDSSTTGTDPDGTDGDGNPDEMTPTTVPFTENPSLTVEKADPTFLPLGNDVYTLTYEFTLANTGDIQLNTIEITDDILSQFSTLNPTNLMAIDGSLLANNSWTGNATSNVLQTGQSLPVGAMGTVSISFDATLSGTETLTNLVNVSTTTPSGTTVIGNNTNVYDFTPPFCPALTLNLGDNVICGNAETDITLTAEPNSGQIGVYYTIDNQLDSTQLYQAGHGGAILLTTISGSASGVNTTFPSGALENNGTAAITYYIYAILNDGNPNISPACNVVAVDEITVNPSPNVTATVGGPFCEGENVQLFITGAKPGEMFQWTGPNGYSSTEQNPTIVAATTANDGDYSAVVTNSFGCTFTTNILDVVVNEMPDAAIVSNNSPTCADGVNDVTLTATTTAAGTINWYKDSNPTSVGTGAILTLSDVTLADAGNYYAIIDNGLCPSNPSVTTEVIIDELPTNQTATTGADELVCNGQSTVNLSANNPAIGTGMWSQAVGNPAGANIANANDPNTLVSNLSAGSYTFTWSLLNGACQNYSSADMTVTVGSALTSPTISGDADVCEEDVLTLTASNASAGATYEWQGPNGFSASTQAITIDPITLNNAGDYSVKIITVEGCESQFSTPTNVTVFPKPATPIIFGNEICDGEEISLQTGSTGDLFEWFGPSSLTVPVATTSTNSVNILSSNAGYQGGNWTVKITDSNGCETEMSAPYNVVIKPTPNTPTANSNSPVCIDSNLQLTASNEAGATYQWSGPNGYSSLQQNPTIANVTAASAGQYSVVAMIDGCASDASTVDVIIGENPIASPSNNGGACGNDLEIFANASGGVGQLIYFWSGPNSFVSSVENPVIPNPSSANEGTYTLVVMDDNGCTAEATTDVTLGGGATVQPEISSNSPSCAGETLTLSTAQYSGQSVSYEWMGPNGTSTTGGDYPNASTIVIPNATAANEGTYTVFVNVDGCGSNTSSAHNVIINNTPTANASTNFSGNCVDGQTDIQLLANAANGDFPYSYIWNGPNGFTSNAANPTIANATEANNGTYSVMVTDGNGCQAEVSTLDLILNNQPATPMIASPQMACDGEKVELTVTNADPSVTYAWTFNGNAISNNDSPTLVIDPATNADSGTYEVTVSKADCTELSATVELTVSTTLMATINDQDFGCVDGATDVVIASNTTGGIAPYTYAWTGPNGFTSTQAMPTIASANADDAGTYNVIVTDDNGCTSGNISAVVSIKDALDQPVFIPLNNAPCEGENVVLEIQQYNGVNVTYSWSFNGNSITNNSNVLIINNVTAANSGIYEVSVTADGCSTPSTANFDLTVNEAIAATVDNQNLTCIDNNTDLTLSANITAGTAPFSYEWSGPNGFTSNAASPVIPNVSVANAGTYEVIITDDNACQSAIITAVIQITEAPDAPTLTTSGNACEGSELVLSTQSYSGTNVTYAWTKDGLAIANNSNVLNINPATANDSGDYVVSVTVDGCTAAPSNIASVEIFENPSITIAAVNAQNCTDGTQSITLDATPADGSGIYTYSWSGPNGFASTDQDPILNNINASMAGTYIVQVFDDNGCEGDVASILVEITNAPDQSQLTSSNPNACEGEEVILSTNAVAGANVSYAWILNGNPITNNSNELILAAIATADAGNYEVTILVDGCVSKSETFIQEAHAKPALTIFPVNDLTCADGATDIEINVEVSTGTAPFTFSWTGPNGFVSADEDPIIQGATSADAGNYQVTFTDANGCVSTAESVTINVTDGIEQPSILTSNGAVCEGEPLTLSVNPYAGANVTYQWSKDGNPIQNNDMPTLSFAAISAANNGNYNLTVTVDGCANFANIFTLNINETPSVTASSDANGNTLECANGTEDIQLMAMVTGGTAPFIYAWTGPNGFTSSLQNPTISGAMEADAGTYQIQVIDANNCESTTAAVELIITDGVAQPQITGNNASGNTNTCEGDDVTLSVTPYTGALVTYEWAVDGVAITNNTNELIIQNATAADAGNYKVIVTVDGCTATSQPFTVEVFGTPMIAIADLPDFTCTDGTQTYNVNATITNGSGVYTYAWTGPDSFQASTEDLSFANATSDINGAYTLTVTDATGCVSESVSVQVYVQDGINEPIISATGPVCEGGEVTLEVTEYQGQNVDYAWTLNGNPLPITGHQYPIQNAMVADAGDYQVTVTVNNCVSTSENFELVVFGSPMVEIAAVDEIPCADGTQDVTLTTTVTGGIAPYFYTWEGPNGFTSTVVSPTLSNVSSLQSGTYTVTVTDANDCGTNATSIEVVIGNGIDQPVIISNTGNVCEGEATQLSVQNYSGANVTFEWYLNNNLIATNTNQHFINAATTADAGSYRVVVAVNDCEASSEEFALEIYTSPQVEIAAVAPITCSDGTQDVTLQTTISQGAAPFIYEWSGPNGYASTVANPVLIDVTEADAGTYLVTVMDANNCAAATASVDVVISDGLDQPTIMAANGASSQSCEGEDITLTVPAYAGNVVTYEWFLNGTSIGNNNNTLDITAAEAADGGNYTVEVHVDGCSATSAAFTQTVFESATVTIDNVPTFGCTSGTQDITINSNVIGGATPYTYSWTGPNSFVSTNADPTISGATEADAGTYILTVTDANNCESETVSVDVVISDGLDQPTIMAANGASSQSCEGEDITLTVPAYAGNVVTYEWFLNGTSIGNNNNTLDITAAEAADGGNYTVEVHVDGCSATSAAFTQTVFESATVTIDNVPTFGCTSGTQDITINSNVIGGATPYTYSWTGPNSFVSTNADPTISGATEADAGTYILTVTDANNCESETVSVDVVISDGLDQPTIMAANGASSQSCEGEDITLTVPAYAGNVVTYEWFLNGTSIGNNNNTLDITAAEAADGGNYTVEVHVDGCSATSAAFTQTVFESATVTIDNVPTFGCTSGTQDITINSNVIGGATPYTYSWTGPNSFVSTNADPTISGATEADAGTYILTVTDANNCESETVSVDVVISDGLDQPTIMAANGASSQSCEGEDITLTVPAYAGNVVTYEWFLNGTSIGNNNNTLDITAAEAADGGNYTVEVNVDGCSATSAAFTQTVFESATVTIDNVPTFGCTSGTQDITINSNVIGGATPYTYSWTGPNSFVSTNADPTISGATEADAGTYILTVTDANNCESETVSVDVVISDGLDQPMISSSTGPSCAGENVMLSVAAYAGNSVSYEWFLNGISIGNNSNELNLAPATSADGGNYTVTVTVDGCTATSAVGFTQTIFDQPTASIVNMPATIGCTDGTETATIDLTPQGGSGVYTYAWTGPNGFASATQDLVFTGVTGADAGTYTVIITDSNNCESDPMSTILDVVDSFDQPVLTSTGPTCEGGSITLSVDAVVGASVTYVWTKDGNQISNNSNELILNPVQISDAGDYQVEITAGNCSGISEMMTVTVYKQPTATIANIPAYECNGGTGEIQLNATVSNGQTPYSFAWTGPNGFTSSVQSPTLFSPNEAAAGTYTLMVTDANNCESLAAAVEVNISDAIDQPVVSYSGATCEGGTVTLTTTAYAGANVNYEWRRNGTLLGNNTNTLTISPVENADAGMYDVTVIVDGCSAQSEAIEVEINESPNVSIAPLPEYACTDGTEDITFNPTVSGGQTPYEFAWTGPNGFQSTVATPTINAADEADAGTYILTVTDANNCVSQTVSVELNISGSIDQPQIAGNGGAVCAGENSMIAVPVYAGANVTYEWFHNGNSIGNNSNELSFTPAEIGDGGAYEVLVTVGNCSSTSLPYTFAVNQMPSAMIELLDGAFDLNCSEGTDDVQLMANITGGTTPYTYVWTGPNGFNSASQTPNLQNVTSDDAGTYNLIITDANNCVSQTASFELNVSDAPDQPQITSSGATCEGGMASISVQNYAGANVDYTWVFNGVILPNNTNELVFNPANTDNAGNYRVTVTVDGCSTISDIFNLEIFDNPNVFINDIAPLECTDGTQDVTFTVAVSGGSGGYTFEWTGPNGFVSTATNPTISGVNANDAGTYILTVTDDNNCASTMTSVELEVTGVGDQPIITSSGPTCEGGTVTLSVEAAAGANVSYQWSRNGIGFVNNSNELIINPVTTADAGNYQVAITADGCTATSDNFNVEIYETPTADINFNQPTTCTDGTASLILNSTAGGGQAPFTYEWTGPNGYTSAEDSPVLTNIDSDDSGVYNLKITDTNGCESATASANVTITDAPDQPVIASTGPVCEGGNVILSVNAYVGANVTYIWTLNGQDLNNNNNELFINAASAADAGDYTVSVTVDGCKSDAENYTLEIYDEPTATIADVPTFACTDGTEDLMFSISVSGGQTPYTFAWTGPNGFNSTEFAPTIESVNEADAGTYILTVSDANGCISNAVSATVEVTENVQQPTITSSGPACEGDEITLSTTALAGANVVYNWTKDGVALNINNPQIILNPVTSADAGDYQVEVSVNNCSNTSAVLDIEVYDKPTATIANLPIFECTDGTQDVTLNATVFGGSGIFGYAWTGPNGFQSATQDPTLNGISEENAGTYLLTVTDDKGCESTTVSVDLVVTDALDQPNISSTGPACGGEGFTLSTTAVSGADYQWFFNGNPVGNNSPALIIDPATAADNGNYAVQVSTPSCDATSANFFQSVGQQPNVFFTAVPPMNCVSSGETVTLQPIISGGSGDYDFAWTGPNDFTSALPNPTIQATAANAGSYTVIVTDNVGCASDAASIQILVTESISQPMISSTGPACEGEMVVISTDTYAGSNVTYAWTLNGNPIANNAPELILSPATNANAGVYVVTVTVDGCSETSNGFTQNINDQPVATITPQEGASCTDGNENIVLESNVFGGTAPYTYSWTGPNGFNSVGQNAFLGNINASNSGTYTLIVTDANGCASDAFSMPLLISDAPDQAIIVVDGASCEGGAVTLSVQQYSGSSVTYIWRKNGVQIPNNSNVLTINSATEADNGEYTVEVQVAGCNTFSNPVDVNVSGSPIVEIETYDPIECGDGNDVITLGATVTGGSGNYTYEWTGPNGFESFAANPVLNGANASISGTYNLMVTDSNGCESDPASTDIFITNGIDQPVIAYDGAVCEGEMVTLSIQQYAGANVTYTWFKDSMEITTATTNQIVFNPIMADDAGEYFVTVQSDDCSSSSNPVQVEVFDQPTVEIADVPTVQCVDGTLDVELDATVTGGTTPYTYLWEGPGYFEVTEDALLTGVTGDDSGTYTLVVTDANGCKADLAVINVTFVDQIPQPVISSNSPVCSGELVEMSVPAYSGTMVEYVWTFNGQPVGENSPNLFIPNATLADAGNYQLEVIADGCSSLSAEYEVIVFENPTVAVTTGPSAFCTSGQDSLVINSSVTGGVAPFTYEWVGPNGFFSVNANPVLQNVNDDMDGSYTVFVTDANGCQSNAFTIEIDIEEGIVEPVITSTGQSCDGDEFTLSVPPYSGQNVTYEWSTPNGITANITGLNSNEIVINPITNDHEGIYTLTVTADGCTNTSDDFNFFILDEPTANPIMATSDPICEGGDLELLANATGNGDLTYAWSGPNGFMSNIPNPTINNVDDNYNGQYLLVVTNQQGCSTSATLTVNNVILPAPPTPTLATNAPICDGEDLVLSTSAAGDMFAWVGPLGDSPSTLQIDSLMTTVGTTTLPAGNESYLGGDWSVMVKDANGCWSEISAPVNVEINEIPQAIATNGGAICAGGDAQLFANVLPNATYEWRIAGTTNIISTQSNPVISEVNEDTVFELLVTLNGCSSEAASTLVLVITAPEAEPEAAYFLNSDCSPSDLQLNANVMTAGNFEFSWSGPNGFTSSLENPVIPNATENANGIYELMISNGNDCAATYGTNLVSVIPNQVAQPIITASNVACAGETLTLTTTQYAGSDVDYVWLQGTTILASSNNNQFVINEITTANEGEYSVTVQVDGCVLTSNVINVAMLQQPTAAPTYVLGNGACEGGNIQLSVNSGNVSGNVTYEWTGPNGFTSSAPNPFIAVTTVDNNGAYTVTVTNSNGCSITENVSIQEIGTQPNTPVASSNTPVCEGGEIVLSVPQPAPGSPIYVWYNGLGEIIGNGQVLTITEGTPEAVSPYSVKLVQNGCESDLSAAIAVSTDGIATPMLTTNDDVLCEGQPLILNATAAASNNATYTWFLDGNLLGTSANPTFIINSPTSANTGIYTVQVNVTGCQSGISNSMSVSIFGGMTVPATANATSPTSPACDGSAVILTTPFITGATYTWFGPNGYTSDNFNPVLTGVSADEAGEYYVIVEVPGCATAVSATTTVYVQPALPVAMIANDGPYCEGDSATLTILNPIVLNPTDTVTYEWFDAETLVSIGTTDTTFIGIADLNENQTGEYYVIMTLNGCAAAASETTFVDVAALPQNGLADAGEDTELCAVLDAELNATLPAGASGMWTSPTGATIFEPTAANSEIADLEVGENMFVWTLSQGGCGEYAADTVIYNVAVIPADLAFAGADENLCGRSTITLDATIPAQATGTWTQSTEQTDAGITIVDANNPNTPIDGLTPGEYTFFWALSEGGCENYSVDTVIINIMDGPMNNAYIAKDEFYACGEEEFTLTAEIPSEGTGIWTSNTGALIVNPTNPTTLVADLAVGENWFYWTLSAPDCPNYSVDSALVVVQDDLQGVEDFYNIDFNSTLDNFDVLANDVFGNVTNTSFEVITRPNHGALIPLNDEGVFDYVPNTNFFGFDTMQYVICNLDCPAATACDTVTVSFLIGGTSSADDCFAPNLITPNGDGMNDALMFPCLAGGNFPDNNIMIFNRWGDKVYEAKPYNNDWMGTYKGEPLPAGSYYYILMLEEGETPLTGFFTVVR